MSFGTNLKKVRKQKSMTQKDLSIKSGVHEIQIARYENDKTMPTLETIKKISHALGVGVFDLIDYQEIENDVMEDFKRDLNKDEYYSIWTGDPSQIALNYRFKLLNKKGRQKALENIGDLARIDLYTEQDQDK